jgi:hypothetical protein
MSYTYLQGQEEVSSEDYCWDTDPCALLKSSSILEKFYSSGNETGFSPDSQSGTMYEPSTENRGEEGLTLSVEDFHAKTLHSLDSVPDSMAREVAYGVKWRESFARLDRKECLWKTPQLSLLAGLDMFSKTWPRWGMMLDGECWELEPVVPQWNASGFGLPAPTKAMGKRGWGLGKKPRYSEELERNARLFGYRPHPSVLEWSMGWIPTWTRLAPLETDRFRKWLHSHGNY